MRLAPHLIHRGGFIREGELIDAYVEVDAVAKVDGGGHVSEAAGERVEAVEGEEFDDEGEIGGNRVKVAEGEIRVGFVGLLHNICMLGVS